MLEFNTAFEKDILVIELEGSLDSHSAGDFRAWFNEKTAAGFRAFAIDCLCLEYISSAGITALIELQSLLQNQNGKMVLYQISGETRQLLRFLQLETKLNLAGDYDDAIAALTGIQKVSKQAAPVPVPSGVEAMVDMGEIQVLKNQAATKPEAQAAPQQPPPAADTQAAAKADSKSGNPPEAKEISINRDGAKRLITCPNCKSVLRVAVAGEYLCPACRFRFAYKPAAS